MKDYALDELLPVLRDGTRPVVLFGAGDVGKLAHCALTELGVDVAFFVDSNKAKHGRLCRGLEVRPPQDLEPLPRDAHIFICGNYLVPVNRLLEKMGFRDIYNCSALLDGYDFHGSDTGMDLVFVERKVALHKRECLKVAEEQGRQLVLKYLDVVVTEACSMKCVDCSNLMQYYSKPKHSDLDLVESAISRIMESVDRIYEFRVLGGEPFVNKRVHRTISMLTAYETVEKVVIYTNATILPVGENLECLKNEKVVVDITNYGAHSRNYESMIELLEKNGVTYLTKIPEWTDSGRINYVERSDAVLDDMFRNCCVNDVITLLNGKLYRCPFSANGTNLGAVPHNDEDVVDLTGDLAGDELRAAVRGMYSKSTHLTACGFCNGRDYRTPKIEAAIQTRRPLPLPLLPLA